MTDNKAFILHEGPAYSLALNKENTHVVVAGRNVFKVFLIEERSFRESANLRCGKTSSVQSTSSMDVTWNPADQNIIATATTCGAVVTWNLSRSSRNKQEHVFFDHRRAVNKVTFHCTESNLLMSGSQDGTMKCFDLRLKEPAKTYSSDTESIRDVQFSPHNPFTFAAASENGTIQIWDTRKPEKCLTKYSAHNGPIFSCDWHSELPFLATASRDKSIKVWNVTNQPVVEYTVCTIAPVGRIKWRPYRRYHLASSALVLDSTISVWDVRRPYSPYASFTKHTDVATCIAWKGDPYVLLSTNRDSTLHQNFVSEADLPLENANSQGISINKDGDLVYCSPTVINKAEFPKTFKESSRKTSTTTSGEEELNTTSEINLFVDSKVSKYALTYESDSFLTCALEYHLQGKLGDICEHNANVALKVGKPTTQLVWNILRILYANVSISAIKEKILSSSNNGNCFGDDDNLSCNSENSLRADITYQLGDFQFGETEIDPLGAELDQFDCIGIQMDYKTVEEDSAWLVPTESIILRHELSYQPLVHNCVSELTPGSSQMVNSRKITAPMLRITSPAKFDPWDPSSTVAEALRYHINEGDVQTAVCVLIVLRDEVRCELTNPKTPHYIPQAEMAMWMTEYIELLKHYKLWSNIAMIIQLSRITSVKHINQTDTSVNLSCGRCQKRLKRNNRYCFKCQHSECARCAICQRIVRGVYAWCRGCAHGGHIEHMREWFSENKCCPTGCGHLCEY